MRGAARVIACTWILVLGTATPSEAIWRWLEKMSGPGWYDGFSLERKWKCGYPTDLSPNLQKALETLEADRGHSRATLAAFLKTEVNGLNRKEVVAEIEARLDELRPALRTEAFMGPAAVSFPCGPGGTIGDISRPRVSTVGFSGGLMWSTINRLRYAPEVPPEDTQVWIATGGMFYDRRLPWSGVERVEVGGSAEAYVFFGKTTKTMPRLALEPRATVALGTIRDYKTGAAAITFKVRAGLLWIVDDFAPEDFGALPTGERLGGWGETLTSVRLVVDIECLPWKRDSCRPTGER